MSEQIMAMSGVFGNTISLAPQRLMPEGNTFGRVNALQIQGLGNGRQLCNLDLSFHIKLKCFINSNFRFSNRMRPERCGWE